MKRVFAAGLALIMILVLTACGGSQRSDIGNDMAGVYRLVDAAGVRSDEILEIKEGFRLEVRADNTATLSLMQDVHELAFDVDKGVCTSSDDDTQVPFTFDGKQLVMDTEPFRMVFEKQ